MKINELYASVAQLGFEDSVEDIPAFFSAANRALLQINALRPLTAIIDIYHRRPENLIPGANHNVYEYNGEEIIFTASGPARAYYFEVMGEGRWQVELYNEKTGEWDIKPAVEFKNTAFTPAYGFVEDDEQIIESPVKFTKRPVRLRFFGEYAFQIRNAALWKTVYSSNVEDIPAYERYARYDLKKYDPNFIGVCDNPFVDGFTRLTKDYYFENSSILILPAEEEGEIKIKYKKAPRELEYTDSPEDDITEIELDPELVQLMPLLVAAYIWADEGDGKAQYYLDLYYRRAAEIEAKNRSREGAKYANVTGW